MYFGSPFFRVVSGAYDNTIRVWNLKNGECEKVISEHKGGVSHMIKWTEDTFLSCGEAGQILCFSIRDFKLVKRFVLEHSASNQLLKLNDKWFLAVTERCEVLVIDYEESKIVYDVDQEIPYYYTSQLLKSNVYSNCFYMNTNDDDNTVKLIDYKNNKVVKRFLDHDGEDVFTITNFLNADGNEILVTGGRGRRMFFYNCGSKKHEEDQENNTCNILKIKKKEEDEEEEEDVISVSSSASASSSDRSSSDEGEEEIGEIGTENRKEDDIHVSEIVKSFRVMDMKTQIISLISLNNEFMCCGDLNGTITLYDTKSCVQYKEEDDDDNFLLYKFPKKKPEDMLITKICEKNIHFRPIWLIEFIIDETVAESSVKVISCFRADRTVKLVSTGCTIKNEFEKMDLSTRIDFLRFCTEEVVGEDVDEEGSVGGSEMMKKIYIDLDLDTKMENLLKIWFL